MSETIIKAFEEFKELFEQGKKITFENLKLNIDDLVFLLNIGFFTLLQEYESNTNDSEIKLRPKPTSQPYLKDK